MSSEAIAWAMKAQLRPSSVKFTLVALCECANYKTGRIFPSIDHIAEITAQNRKTIITNLAALIEGGWIEDTGDRVGATGQIKVYRACTETIPNLEQSRKRNSSAFTREQSQKRDTEPSKEPSSNNKRERAHYLPDDWLPVLTVKAQQTVDRWPPGRFDSEVTSFRDHAADKGRLSKDWQAAFRTWINNVNRWSNPHGNQPASDEPQNPYVRAVLKRQVGRAVDGF